MISAARKVAFSVLGKTEEGGYASDLLLSHAAGLDSRDAGLASEIVFGCLRRQAQLDWLIKQATNREPARMDMAVRLRFAWVCISYVASNAYPRTQF